MHLADGVNVLLFDHLPVATDQFHDAWRRAAPVKGRRIPVDLKPYKSTPASARRPHSTHCIRSVIR